MVVMQIVNRFRMIGTQIAASFQAAVAGVRAAVAGISAAFASIVGRITAVVAQIQAAFARIPGVIQGAMSQAVAVVQGAVGAFQSAGASLMQALASGIQSAVGAAVSAVSGAVSQIRGMLPFSPAKYGPLSDLDKTGPALLNTVAAGINPSPLVNALGGALAPAAAALPAIATPPIPQQQQTLSQPSFTPQQQAPLPQAGGGGVTVNITLNGDGADMVEQLRERGQEIAELVEEAVARRDRTKYA